MMEQKLKELKRRLAEIDDLEPRQRGAELGPIHLHAPRRGRRPWPAGGYARQAWLRKNSSTRRSASCWTNCSPTPTACRMTRTTLPDPRDPARV